jgi:2-hydroxychromene-2-carboxylate isomerase
MDAAFYFDLASPLAYLAAERVLHVLGGPAEWQPVLASELPGGASHEAFRCEAELDAFREDVARAARAQGAQPLRWPEPFPFDSTLAMRAATYAKGIGRVVPFAQAAFRQAFAGGHDLQRTDFVLIAAAACEMHPEAILRGTELRSVREQLTHTTTEAAAAGVRDVPAVRIGRELFSGARAVEEAARYLAGEPAAARYLAEEPEAARSFREEPEAARSLSEEPEATQHPAAGRGAARNGAPD